MTGPRDWDKEMAEIDKLMASDKAPAAAPSGSPPARREGAPAAPVARASAPSGSSVTRRRDAVGVWLVAVLGALGALALWYWPYNKTCGTWLYGYLVGVAAVAACGLMTMRNAWTHRRGLAHVVGLLTFLAGLAFAAIEVLPRIGYAAVPHSWTCP